MRTNYDSPGFAGSFERSRPIEPSAATVWANIMRRATSEPVRTVLDLGAGTGRFWPVIFAAWPGVRIVAVDNSPRMLAAAPGHERVQTIVADLDNLPDIEVTPEVVFCSMALHYSADPMSLCRAVRGMLAPGSVFVVRTSTRETSTSNVVYRYLASARAAQEIFPLAETIEGWLTDAGFVVNAEVVSQPAAPTYSALLVRCLRRGLPALQSVPTAEFVLGTFRLTLWAFAQKVRGRPVPLDQTTVFVGRAA